LATRSLPTAQRDNARSNHQEDGATLREWGQILYFNISSMLKYKI